MWEKVTGDCERLKVPGGWIYRTWHTDLKGNPGHPAVAYVPDPAVLREILLRAAGALR